jgi:hypothetical protein
MGEQGGGRLGGRQSLPHPPQLELGGEPPGRENQMKLVKLTLLAITAAIAAMAFIGASSASAFPGWIASCAKPQLLNCEGKWLVKHPLPGRFIPLVGPGKFNSGFVTVECEKGEGRSNEIESEQNKEFKGTLEELGFSGCKGCTGVKVTTPQKVVLNMETETGGWRLKTETTPGKVEFTGCPFGTTCFYEGEINLEVQMDEEGSFADPKGLELKRGAGSGALCAEKGKWESGRMRWDWELDDFKFPFGTRHVNITQSLIGPNLIEKLNGLGVVG